MPGSGILPIPTKAFLVSLEGGASRSFELETDLFAPRRKRMNCGPIRPRITEVWLINGFSIPFAAAIGSTEKGEEGEAPLEIPDIQMDIFDNNVLVYSSGLAAVTPQNAQTSGAGSQGGWGLLTADLTNPIPVESHSQLEIGIRGFGPIRAGGAKTIVELGLNFVVPPNEGVINALAELIGQEAARRPQGNGPGNFRYEAVDK